MKEKYISILVCLLFIVFSAFAENTYIVTSSSSLNIRKSPSTTSAKIGILQKGEEIEVISISNGWAKISYKDKVGYVSEKFISPVNKEVVRSRSEENKNSAPTDCSRQTNTETELYENETISYNFNSVEPASNKLTLCFAVQGGAGLSNFVWSGGNVNGTLSYSGDLLTQLYFDRRVSFIPKNWYSEIAIGYDKRGSADIDMSYVHANIYPFGYSIPLSQCNVVIKAGATLAYPLTDLYSKWSPDFQIGVGGGVQLEWKRLAVGCNLEYDFTEVSGPSPAKLNNFAVLGTVSYKFVKISK